MPLSLDDPLVKGRIIFLGGPLVGLRVLQRLNHPAASQGGYQLNALRLCRARLRGATCRPKTKPLLGYLKRVCRGSCNSHGMHLMCEVERHETSVSRHVRLFGCAFCVPRARLHPWPYSSRRGSWCHAVRESDDSSCINDREAW